MGYTIDTFEELDLNYIELCTYYNGNAIEECPICGTNIAPELMCDISDGSIHNFVIQCPKCCGIIIHKWDYSKSSEMVFPKHAAKKRIF